MRTRIQPFTRKGGKQYYLDVRANGSRKRIPVHEGVCRCTVEQCEHYKAAEALQVQYNSGKAPVEALEPVKRESRGISFAAFRKRYKEHLEGSNKAKSYVVSVEHTMRLFEDYLKQAGIATIERVKPLEVDEFKVQLRNAGRKCSSVNVHLRNLRAAFGMAETWELIAKNPASSRGNRGLMLKTSDSRKINYLDKAEVAKVLANWDSDVMHRIFTFAVVTGCRLGEILNLTWEQISGECVRIEARDDWRPKSNDRTIPLHAKALEVLKVQKRGNKSRYVFPSDVGTKMDERNCKRRMRSLFWKYRLKGVNKPHKLTFHSLRHTFATQMIYAGVPIADVSKLLGHSAIQITFSTYAGVLPDEQRKNIAKLEF